MKPMYAPLVEDDDPPPVKPNVPLPKKKRNMPPIVDAQWLAGRHRAISAEDGVREASHALGIDLEVKEVGPEGKQSYQWLFRDRRINLSFWPGAGSWQENRSKRNGIVNAPVEILGVLAELLGIGTWEA